MDTIPDQVHTADPSLSEAMTVSAIVTLESSLLSDIKQGYTTDPYYVTKKYP